MIERVKVKNYKILRDVTIKLNDTFNILVGQNESGKSTILEAIGIATTGRLHFYPFDRQLRANLFNNEARKAYMDGLNKYYQSETTGPVPPKIVIELYLKEDDSLKEYVGTNNELGKSCPGIRVEASFNDAYSDYYKNLLANRAIDDIPVELYRVKYNYFSSKDVLFRFNPVKSVLIDASHKDYSNIVSHFISSNIDEILTNEEKLRVSEEYRKNRQHFKESEDIKRLNGEISKRNKLDDRPITLEFEEENIDAWKEQMTLSVSNVPFDNVGFGTQNVIKTKLAIQNSPEKVNVMLMEEPENNLSYTNMTKMLYQINTQMNKQIIIATHSSYVANVLSLKNLLLVSHGEVTPFNNLSSEAYRFFQKLPGYDTLRIVLANKVMLVEGAADKLVVEKYYKDMYDRLPIEDGIDIIVAGGLTFKRFCDIAIFLEKNVVVLTDNDSHPDKLQDRYKGYIGNKYVHFFYEKDPKLHTLEPSVLAVNSQKDKDNNLVPDLAFQHIVNHQRRDQMTFKELDEFMENNKVEWALRVVESEEKIQYPEYIVNAIKYVKEHC